MAARKLISVVTPCFNEEGNVDELYQRIAAQFALLPDYDFEHIYIDNASTDGTAQAIRRLASTDSRVKAISTRAISDTSGPRSTPSCNRGAMRWFPWPPTCRTPRS
jgi:glycosyltransferase involved in cell wall biosynthesis